MSKIKYLKKPKDYKYKTAQIEIYYDKNILLVMLDNTRFISICNRYSK
jgi:hypothetical protein